MVLLQNREIDCQTWKFFRINFYLKKYCIKLDQCCSVVGALARTPKGRGLIPGQGHLPGLLIGFLALVRAVQETTNLCVFLI